MNGPEILWEGTDDARLAELGPVQRRDLSDGMRIELARVLDPSPGGSDGAREQASRAGAPWVYYPWRAELLRVLERDAFRRVRLSRNRAVIEPDEQASLGGAQVGIVGLSVGHTMARTLAMQGVGAFRLIDADALELSNLNRVPLGVPEIGLPKAEICARRLWELDPYLTIDVWAGALAPEDAERFVSGLDVVVDACDGFGAKAALRMGAKACGVPLVMETSFRGTLDVENYRRDPDYPPFHGALEGAAPPVTEQDRVDFFERLLGPLSERVERTLRGLGQTYVSYPQTANDIMLGGASVSQAVRRLVLGPELPSGRWRVDLEGILDSDPE